MDSSLGARLRAHRERQQITLDAISAETKIKLCVLEGLERDDVSQWPEGIYRRAYVRAYARAIGLDPQDLVREFLQVHPDPIVVPPPEDQTELETPHWPAEFRRLVTTALAAVPARKQRIERAWGEPAPGAADPPPAAAAPVNGARHDAAPTIRDSRPSPDLLHAAELCGRLGRAMDRAGIVQVLEDAARTLDAVGMIVWAWNAGAAGLVPVFSCGYADGLVARMPVVHADADNGIAAAFRSADTCVIAGTEGATGALIVPLLAGGRCAGVLAAEIRGGGEQGHAVRAFAAILAAQFVTFIGLPALPEAVNA